MHFFEWLLILLAGPATEEFLAAAQAGLEARPPAPLLSSGVAKSLAAGVEALQGAGAQVVTGGRLVGGAGYRYAHTLLRVSGDQFLAAPVELQTEAFGASALAVVARDAVQAVAVLECLEGNLTGCIYSDTKGADDALHARVEPVLRRKVGRLLNDKMPTGVAVSPAMNHGGPFPATGHPGFTAIGIPAALRRFGALHCYDNVRHDRLPAILRDDYGGPAWRLIDGQWRRGA